MSTRTESAALVQGRARLRAGGIAWLRIRRRSIRTGALLLAGYGLSRVVTTGLLALAYWLASTNDWPVAHFDGGPGFLGFLHSWDGRYYEQITVGGYPTRLPVDGSGAVAQSPWAFLPLYPLIVRGVMAVTTLGFPITGVLVAAAFGAGATAALYVLLRQRFTPRTAFWGAMFFCFGPLSFVLQVTYADSVFLFFMYCSLIAMVSRRFLLMIPFAVAAAFAHPGALALAAAVGVQSLIRLVRRQHFPRRERVTAGIALATITVAGVAWPIIAAVVTGNPGAYFDSEVAWWSDYLGHTHFVPFTPWFAFADHYWGVVGILLVVAILAALVWWFFSRRAIRVYGTDLLAYAGSYLAYLVAVFLPQQSMFRMLLPLSPLLGHPVLSGTVRRRRIVLGVCVTLQALGVLLFWVVWPP